MSDLETRIREALSAGEIGWDDLRQPTLRVASRTPRRWPTALATAAAVAVVATVASLIAVTRGSTGPAAHPGYAGYLWRVIGVTDRAGSIPGAASVPARIAFSDTAVSATVAGASIFGHYHATRQGYRVRDVGLTSAGPIAGGKKERIGSAVLHLFLRETQGSAPDLTHPATVAALVHGDRLALQAQGVTVRLLRVGPARLSPMIDAVGYSWRIEALRDAHGRLTLPHRFDAVLGFDSVGFFVAKFSVHNKAGLFGQFGLSKDGYVVLRRVGRDAVGGTGHDRTARRLKAAVDAMVENHVAVTATVDGDTLTLHRGAFTLTLHRGVRMRGVSEQSGAAASPGATSAPPSAITARPTASRQHSGSNSAVRHAHAAGGSHH